MSTFKIPTEVKAYQQGMFPDVPEDAELTYEPTAGEVVHVLLWERYPSYDFIFGVPAVDSPRYEKEIGFFQFRDTRAKEVRMGLYVDVFECLAMINGFTKISEVSKTHHKKLWDEIDRKSVRTV